MNREDEDVTMNKLVRRVLGRRFSIFAIVVTFVCITITVMLSPNNRLNSKRLNNFISGARTMMESQQDGFELETKSQLRVAKHHLLRLGLPCSPEDIKGKNLTNCKAPWDPGYPSVPRWINDTKGPVVVSFVRPRGTGNAVNLVRNVQHYLPHSTMVIFQVGLSKYDIDLLTVYCRKSCIIRDFKDDLFPSHVAHLGLVPLILQMVLSAGADQVIYLSPGHVMTTGNVSRVLQAARGSGVATWTDANRPTTSLTHPNMFGKLGVSRDAFRFQHAISLRALVLTNTRNVQTHLMLPWVKCALVSDCIDPVGAQNTGCRYDKKPQYRYSGCHEYDTSALNVLLGVMFDFDESKYIMQEAEKFFSPILELQPETGGALM